MYYLLSVLKWVFYLFMGLFAVIGLAVLLVGLFGTKTGLVIGMGLSILLLGAFCYGVAFFLNRFSKNHIGEILCLLNAYYMYLKQ